MKGELAFFVYHGMARVASALVADYDIIVFRKQIDHPALSFVAPVDADYSTVFH